MISQKPPVNVGDYSPEGNIEKSQIVPLADTPHGLTTAIKPYLLWSREDRWNYLVSVYGDESSLPDEIVQDIWGLAVLGARNAPQDCPACEEIECAGSQLCGYHESRCCPICGGVSSCKSWCPYSG